MFTGKLPLIQEVRDLSTEEIRIDLILKKDADEDKVLAYLYKHTPFQTNFNVNMTCLVPTENPEVRAKPVGPERNSLALSAFSSGRCHAATGKRTGGVEQANSHPQGICADFRCLDEIIQIIRRSDGKADAAQKIMKRFPAEKGGLDEEQTDAILELKLYRLARLEINLIQQELKDKQSRARQIRKLLGEDTVDTNASGRWKIVRDEIESLVSNFCKDTASKRRTIIETIEEEPEYSVEDFIVAEDCHVMITTDGWVKRQNQIADPAKSRVAEGRSSARLRRRIDAIHHRFLFVKGCLLHGSRESTFQLRPDLENRFEAVQAR